jgi:hypothetical protein
MNGIRHGLTGQIDVLTAEEREVYDQLCSAFAESLAPETVVERHFAYAVAAEMFRLNRARSIENNIFALAAAHMEDSACFDDSNLTDTGLVDSELPEPEIDPLAAPLAAARTFIADPHRFQLLTLYEQRIHRTMQKNLKQLIELQTARQAVEARQKALRDQALGEARSLSELADMEGVPYDHATDYPDPNGFAFANTEITASTVRQRRLQQAAERLRPINDRLQPINDRPQPVKERLQPSGELPLARKSISDHLRPPPTTLAA